MSNSRPFPGLSDIFTQSGVAVGSATYAVVFIQLFLVPLLLNKITKPIVLTLVIGMHLLTALFMALPWSSFASVWMICATGSSTRSTRSVTASSGFPPNACGS